MVNLFLKNKRFKHYHIYSNTIKLFSFRRHAFNSYFSFFIRFSLLYLNRIYMLFQSTRLFSLFFLVFCSKRFVMNGLNSSMRLFDFTALNSYYFNPEVSSYKSVLSFSSSTCKANDIFHFLKAYFYNFFVIFYLSNSHSINLVSLPKVNKIFTVLRSPHTDKKSREQFNLTMSSKLFTDSLGLTSIFLKNLNNLYLSSLFLRISEKNSYFY